MRDSGSENIPMATDFQHDARVVRFRKVTEERPTHRELLSWPLPSVR